MNQSAQRPSSDVKTFTPQNVTPSHLLPSSPGSGDPLVGKKGVEAQTLSATPPGARVRMRDQAAGACALLFPQPLPPSASLQLPAPPRRLPESSWARGGGTGSRKGPERFGSPRHGAVRENPGEAAQRAGKGDGGWKGAGGAKQVDTTLPRRWPGRARPRLPGSPTDC